MAIAGAINILLGLESAKFTAGTNKAVGGLRKFKAEAAGLQGALGGLNGVLGAFGLSVGISQTIGFLSDSIAAFEESHKSALKLNAVLEATGGVGGRSAEQINTFADELERLTAVDDAVIRGGAAVLATFKSLSGDGFDRALKGAIDLAAVMETDVKSAAMQLGKALSDPANGLAALGRAGVKFTEEEKNLIASLVESNQVLEAQDMILDKLEGKVGGVAAKMTTEIDKLSTSFGNLKESIGSLLTVGAGGGLIGLLTTYLEGAATALDGINSAAKDGASFDSLKDIGRGMANMLNPFDPIAADKLPVPDLLQPLETEAQKQAKLDATIRKDLNFRDRWFMRTLQEEIGNPDGFDGLLNPPRKGAVGDDFLTKPMGPERGNDFWREGVDRFQAALVDGMANRLEERQQANIDAANAQPRGFSGFASGNEMGSAGAFESIAAFKFGRAGGDQTPKMTLEEAQKANKLLEEQNRLMRELILNPVQELEI